MQRAEQTGLGIAVAGHILLFGALSLGLIAVPKPVPPLTQPVDIQIVDEVGLKDTVPNPSPVEPAASVAPEVGPPVEAPLPEPITKPLPKVAPAPAPPKPTPKVATPTPKPAPKAAPATPPRPKLALNLPKPAAATPRGSRLGSDFLKGVTDRPSASTAQTPRAAAGPAVEASLARELLRQLRPFWQKAAPTGADVDKLRTTVAVRLAKDGSVISVRVIDTTGENESNRNQVRLHQEAAVKAVRLAAPFVFPVEQYDAWQFLEPVLYTTVR
jgi:outer membrane biosynthesis protein TonB